MIFASIPTPPISSFSVGPFNIHFYSLCILIGVFVAVGLTTIRSKKNKSEWLFNDILDLICVSFPVAIIGARVYYVITMPALYLKNPIGAFKIWEGGLGIIGGLVFGIVCAYIVAKVKKKSFATLLFLAVPTIPVAQAIGRLGNWFNGELYGAPTNLPWGLNISRGQFTSTQLYHPTFLYEIIWNLFIFVILFNIKGMKLEEKFGTKTAILPIYFMTYSIGRFFIELLRQDQSSYIFGLRVNLFFIVGLFIGSLIALIIMRNNSIQNNTNSKTEN